MIRGIDGHDSTVTDGDKVWSRERFAAREITIIGSHVRAGSRVHDPAAMLHGEVIEGDDEGRVVPSWRGGRQRRLVQWRGRGGVGGLGEGPEDVLTRGSTPLTRPGGEAHPQSSWGGGALAGRGVCATTLAALAARLRLWPVVGFGLA
jgi:hypothetical protein